MIIINLVLALLKLREDSSLLTSSIVNLWLAFLMWSALASQPGECNTILNSNAVTFVQIFTHLIWTIITMVSLSVASSDDDNNQNIIAKAVAEDD